MNTHHLPKGHTMTDHADQDAREAREWAEYITSVRELHGDYAPQARAAARFILDNTTPALPDPLFGARATHPKYGVGIIGSRYPNVDGDVRFMFLEEAVDDGTNYQWVEPYTLTFHTPDTPDHPEFLETEEDYRSAPEGTVVAMNKWKPLFFSYGAWRCVGSGLTSDHEDMAGIRRRVLRRGWEA